MLFLLWRDLHIFLLAVAFVPFEHHNPGVNAIGQLYFSHRVHVLLIHDVAQYPMVLLLIHPTRPPSLNEIAHVGEPLNDRQAWHTDKPCQPAVLLLVWVLALQERHLHHCQLGRRLAVEPSSRCRLCGRGGVFHFDEGL